MGYSGINARAFRGRGKDAVQVTLFKVTAGITRILKDFADEDDAIQMRRLDPIASLTNGLYKGNTSANLHSNVKGEIIFKFLETGADNEFFGRWIKELDSGILDPATIIVKTIQHKHTGFNCIPVIESEATPAAQEDPGTEWRLECSDLSLWNKIGGIDLSNFDVNVRL